MSPLYEFRCNVCSKTLERIVTSSSKTVECPECKGECQKILSLFGGYQISGNNSASARPKQAGSFKKK